MDLEQVFTELGQFGRYQVLQFTLLAIPLIASAFEEISYIFTSSDVNYRWFEYKENTIRLNTNGYATSNASILRIVQRLFSHKTSWIDHFSQEQKYQNTVMLFNVEKSLTFYSFNLNKISYFMKIKTVFRRSCTYILYLSYFICYWWNHCTKPSCLSSAILKLKGSL